MAIVVEEAFGNQNNGADLTMTFPSWTPGSDELVLVGVSIKGDRIPSSIVGNGLTFVLVVQIPDRVASPTYVHSIWRAMDAAPTTGAVVVTIPAAVAAQATLARLSGMDTTGTDGSGAIEVVVSMGTAGVGSPDYMMDITTLTDGAFAWSGGDHRNSVLVLEPGEIPVSINNFSGSGGNNHSASTFYIHTPTAGLVTLGGLNNLSGNSDRWGMAGLSIKPDTGPPPPVVTLNSGSLAATGQITNPVVARRVFANPVTLNTSGDILDVVVPNIISVVEATLSTSSPAVSTKLTVTVPINPASLSTSSPFVEIDAPAGVESNSATLAVQGVTLADVISPTNIAISPVTITTQVPTVDADASIIIQTPFASLGIAPQAAIVKTGILLGVNAATLTASSETITIAIIPVVEVFSATLAAQAETLDKVFVPTDISVVPATLSATAPFVELEASTAVAAISATAAVGAETVIVKTGLQIAVSEANLAATGSPTLISNVPVLEIQTASIAAQGEALDGVHTPLVVEVSPVTAIAFGVTLDVDAPTSIAVESATLTAQGEMVTIKGSVIVVLNEAALEALGQIGQVTRAQLVPIQPTTINAIGVGGNAVGQQAALVISPANIGISAPQISSITAPVIVANSATLAVTPLNLLSIDTAIFIDVTTVNLAAEFEGDIFILSGPVTGGNKTINLTVTVAQINVNFTFRAL